MRSVSSSSFSSSSSCSSLSPFRCICKSVILGWPFHPCNRKERQIDRQIGRRKRRRRRRRRRSILTAFVSGLGMRLDTSSKDREKDKKEFEREEMLHVRPAFTWTEINVFLSFFFTFVLLVSLSINAIFIIFIIF